MHSCCGSFSCKISTWLHATTLEEATIPRGSRKTQERTYKHGNLRASRLDAADAVLAERDPRGSRCAMWPRAAGVSHGAPYHTSPAWNELRAAVGRARLVVRVIAMAQAVAVADTSEQLRACAHALRRMCEAQPRVSPEFGPDACQQGRTSRDEMRGRTCLRLRAGRCQRTRQKLAPPGPWQAGA